MNIQLQVAQWFDDYNRRAAARLDAVPALRGLYEPVYYTISQHGKRLRPTLMLCAQDLQQIRGRTHVRPHQKVQAQKGLDLFR